MATLWPHHKTAELIRLVSTSTFSVDQIASALSVTRGAVTGKVEAAKAKGLYKGRPVTFDRARIVSLRKEGMGAREIAGSYAGKSVTA
jgi:hypothetical protein